MSIPIRFGEQGHPMIEATIVNMSDEGLMVAFAPTERVPLFRLFSIEVESHFSGMCYAVWQTYNRAGMVLCTPIHPSVVWKLARSFPAPASG